MNEAPPPPAFFSLPEDPAWKGLPLIEQKDRELSPGGRCTLRLFERATPGARPNPRLRIGLPRFEDPLQGAAREALFERVKSEPPRTAAEFEAWLRANYRLAEPDLMPPAQEAPDESPRAWALSLRAGRVRDLFDAAQQRLHAAELSETERLSAQLALARVREEATLGAHTFDDEDTGTYHSFGHDQPFVHWLEALLEDLPTPGSPALTRLSPTAAAAVLRQRAQAQTHLDLLMRSKYVFDKLVEEDIEPGLGGFLIDRESREIVSERPESRATLRPEHEVLRIASGRDRAGEAVYRDGDTIRLGSTGEPLNLGPLELVRTQVDSKNLTFRRAPRDSRLRHGVRFDWDGNGWIQSDPITWVSWAGHCDIKAILEQAGLCLTDPDLRLEEYRSDSDRLRVWDRDLLLEMLASMLEFGSTMEVLGTNQKVERGRSRFGGARNDARPDRIQLEGLQPGASLRWPWDNLTGRMKVLGIEREGKKQNLDHAFAPFHPNFAPLSIEPNPDFLRTIEGDYSLISVTGAILHLQSLDDTLDPATGWVRREPRSFSVEIAPLAPINTPTPPVAQRILLGRILEDAADRRFLEAWLDRAAWAVQVQVHRGQLQEGRWILRHYPAEDRNFPLKASGQHTLSREARREDPALFRTLLESALHRGEAICADTDLDAEVWNGVVTAVFARKLGEYTRSRTEHWRYEIAARFGDCTLDLLIEREPDGKIRRTCSAVGDSEPGATPDFLWQELPDVASKGLEGEQWVVNARMRARGILGVRSDPMGEGGWMVDDDHIQAAYELLLAALGDTRFVITHNGSRYVFSDRSNFEAAITQLRTLSEATGPLSA